MEVSEKTLDLGSDQSPSKKLSMKKGLGENIISLRGEKT